MTCARACFVCFVHHVYCVASALTLLVTDYVLVNRFDANELTVRSVTGLAVVRDTIEMKA